jgi:hypothetical protein
MDHTGGMRAFVAEGATVYVPAQDKAYFEQIARPHTRWSRMRSRMKPVNVQGVADTSSIKDDNEQINLYNIALVCRCRRGDGREQADK